MSLRFASTPQVVGTVLCCAGPVLGAAEPHDPERSYNLPRGDAATNLRQFAGISGRQVLFMMDKVQGEQTNAIEGDFSPREAIDRMLAGTSLIALQDTATGGFVVSRRFPSNRRAEVEQSTETQPQPSMKNQKNLSTWLLALLLGSPTVALEAQQAASNASTTTTMTAADLPSNPPSDTTVTLSPFEVSGTSEKDGYAVRETNSSARVAQAYIDTSQTISVLNSTYIDDFNIQDSRRLMENLPNTYTGSWDQQNKVWIRGSEVDTVYENGVILGTYAGGNGAKPMQFFDRVELVSGPSSSAFGVGAPGGIINYVTKAPTGHTGSSLEVGFGDYQNYFANLDTEGRFPATQMLGNIFYRAVGFWDQGNYQFQDENHKGVGGMLVLRDEFNQSTTFSLNLQYSATDYPLSDQPFILYTNQTAYTWLDEIIGGPDPGGPFPILPGTKTLPPAGSPQRELGDAAGGQLLTPGTNGFPDNYGGFNDNQFRVEFVAEKSFLDHELTVRNTTVLQTESIDAQYISWGGAYYIDPSTGQPFKTTFPNNIGPIQDIALYLGASEVWKTGEARSDNLDIDYHKNFGGVDLRLAVGGDANESWSNTPDEAIYAAFTKADGTTPLWVPINTKFSVNVSQHPFTNIESDIQSTYSWGFYADATATFFRDMFEVELGDRADAGGAKDVDALHNRITYSPLEHSKGAARESIRFKPLPWLSLYALRAEHDDPPVLEQRYALASPGINIAALEAKYNGFNNPFTLIPKGVLKEYGVKAEFLHGNIVLSADFFQFSTAGGLTTAPFKDANPSSPTYESLVVESVPSTNQASGGEFECAGRITDHLTFTFAYGITRGRFAPFADGNVNYIDPPTTTNLHLKYNVGWIHGFDFYAFGGVMRWGTFYDSQDPYIYYQTAQYVFDGGVGVKWDRGRQSLEASEDNIGGKLPFISPQTAYASSSELEQAFVKYKIKF